MSALASPRPLRARVPYRPALIGAGVLVLELVIALGITEPRFTRLLVLPLAAICLALVFSFPFAAACVLLGLVGSINAPEMAFSLGPVDARVYELLLGALVLVALVRPRQTTWGGWPGGALAAFLGVLSLSTLLAVSEGAVRIESALPWARGFYLYAIFFVVVRLFGDRESLRRLLVVGTGLGAISGVVAALIALVPTVGSTLDFGVSWSTQTSLDDARRVQVPGLGLAYALFWLAIVQVVRTRGWERTLWGLAVAGMALNIVVSQNRNMLIGLLLGLMLMLVFGDARLRHRVLLGAGVMAAGATLMLFSGFEVEQESRVASIVERGTTLFDPSAVGQEQSLTHRADETQVAWQTARENLLFGIGPGTDFGVTFGERRADGTTRSTTQNFVHNQYLYLLMIGGVPLIVTFLSFLGGVLWQASRQLDATVLPLAVGLVMIMSSAVVMIYFSSFEMVATIALLTGVLVAWTRSPEALPPA